MAQPIKAPVVVDRVVRHTDDVVTLHMTAGKKLPRFVPGQFVHLTREVFDPAGFWPDSRVFSVANSVADRRTISLTISRQGQYTSGLIDNVSVGDEMWCKGPYGEFTLGQRDAEDHVVLLAGGTGITPFCAFFDSALQNDDLKPKRVTLHYGAARSDLLIYRSLVERLENRQPQCFDATYYAETVNGDLQEVVHGAIDIDRVVNAIPELDLATFYLSGPLGMIRAFERALLNRYGVAESRILIDAWE